MSVTSTGIEISGVGQKEQKVPEGSKTVFGWLRRLVPIAYAIHIHVDDYYNEHRMKCL